MLAAFLNSKLTEMFTGKKAEEQRQLQQARQMPALP